MVGSDKNGKTRPHTHTHRFGSLKKTRVHTHYVQIHSESMRSFSQNTEQEQLLPLTLSDTMGSVGGVGGVECPGLRAKQCSSHIYIYFLIILYYFILN